MDDRRRGRGGPRCPLSSRSGCAPAIARRWRRRWNLVDDARPARAAALLLLDALERETGTAGARHRSLGPAPASRRLDGLVRRCAPGRSVGVIAVDPSSRRTGGALLGDRVRVRPPPATRRVLPLDGGPRAPRRLAEATRASVRVLAASDVVLIETVGVGQSESEVAELVDTLAFVTQPGAGDLLQFMKAGVLELPDVFVVNKADQGAPAERTARELEAGLGLGERAGEPDWRPRVVLTSARDGRGVEALLAVLDARERRPAAASPRAAARARPLRVETCAPATAYGLAAVGRRGPRRSPAGAPPGLRLAERLGREIERRLQMRRGARVVCWRCSPRWSPASWSERSATA
jgi:LAO/AO transport system kinase